MKCPECDTPLDEKQVRSLWTQLVSGKRKAKRGGKPKLSAAAKRAIEQSNGTGEQLAAFYGISVGHALRVRRAGREKRAAARKAALDRMASYDVVIGPWAGRVT